jgi:hypothetical protein
MLLQPLRAITIRTRPWLSPILVPAIFSIVRILHVQQLKILFPIRSLFLQRSCAKACLHPMRRPILSYARILHVVNIFVPSDRAFSQRTVLHRFQECLFAPLLHTCFDQIPHAATTDPVSGLSANAKFETRNSKFETNSKSQIRVVSYQEKFRTRFPDRHPLRRKWGFHVSTTSMFADWNFELRVCFEFRVSNF